MLHPHLQAGKVHSEDPSDTQRTPTRPLYVHPNNLGSSDRQRSPKETLVQSEGEISHLKASPSQESPSTDNESRKNTCSTPADLKDINLETVEMNQSDEIVMMGKVFDNEMYNLTQNGGNQNQTFVTTPVNGVPTNGTANGTANGTENGTANDGTANGTVGNVQNIEHIMTHSAATDRGTNPLPTPQRTAAVPSGWIDGGGGSHPSSLHTLESFSEDSLRPCSTSTPNKLPVKTTNKVRLGPVC